jgi:polysaccharide export outer membrane protein
MAACEVVKPRKLSIEEREARQSEQDKVSKTMNATKNNPVIFLLLILSVSVPLVSQQLQSRPRYHIQPGDAIEVRFRYTPEFDQTVIVQPDGNIALNVVGEINVDGKTAEEARQAILTKAGERLNQPEVTLVLKDFHRPYFTVAGLVEHPGSFEMRENTTALQAVLLAGGFKENARPSQIVVFRKINSDTAEVKIVNLKNIKNAAQLEHDLPLQSGDMLLVPETNLSKLSRFMKLANVGAYINPFAP